jgi:hypothetical protein
MFSYQYVSRVGDTSESAELVSSMFKDNVSEVELQIIHLHTGLSLKESE